jgi:hypothetical protein
MRVSPERSWVGYKQTTAPLLINRPLQAYEDDKIQRTQKTPIN